MKREIISRIVICCFLFPLFFSPLLLTKDVQDEQTNSGAEVITKLGDEASINWTKMMIRVKGNGFGPENVKELGRRKILAKRAAKIDAFRNMLEVVKGVYVTSYTRVEDMILASDSIKTKADGMIKGMEVIDAKYSNDGGCEITAEVNIGEKGDFLLTSFNSGEVIITDNYPKFDWIAQRNELEIIRKNCASLSAILEQKDRDLNESNLKVAILEIQLNDESRKLSQLQNEIESVINANYTGILVDGRGLKLKPALAPAIINEDNKKIYGIGGLPTNPKRGSLVSYLHGNVEWVKNNKNDKIGNNPLVVKGIKPVNMSDLMISNEDAWKIAWINDVLEKGKVAILI